MHGVGSSAGGVGGGATQGRMCTGCTLAHSHATDCFALFHTTHARTRAQKYRERTRDHLGDVVPDGFDAIHGAAVGAVTVFLGVAHTVSPCRGQQSTQTV